MKRFNLAAVFVTAAMFSFASPLVQAAPTVVYVDDSAAPGGDGTAGSPVQSIQEGIALLPPAGGTVAIHPGTYFGPISVERDDVILWGLSNPVYDQAGFLAGFDSEDPNDNEVVVTIDYPHEEGDPQPGNSVDLIALHGGRNEVHNLVVDSRSVPLTASLAAISAVAEDDEFYEDVVFSHIIIRGIVDLGGFSAKADVVFEYITALDPGFVGIWSTGNGRAKVHRAHITQKSAGVTFSALDEQPKAENGASSLEADLTESKLADSNGFVGFFAESVGLLIIGRKNGVNPDQSSTIVVEASGNTFEHNRRGVAVWPVHGTNGFSTEATFIGLYCHDNAYSGNILLDAEVDFRAPEWGGNYFAANSSVLVIDEDGVFSDPADVDLGPAENDNEYMLITP